MKNLFTILAAIFLTSNISAQQSKTFKYQAVARNNTGDIIADQPVSVRTSIIQDSINGTLTYSETHSITTNPFGMIVLEIGNGTVEIGVFEDIAWGTTSHFLQLEMDETGGTNYQFMGTSELLSVPYSMNSGSVTLSSPEGGSYEVKVDNDGNLIANCFPQASIAEAGADTVHATSPVSLAANTPDSGTGVWTIIRGTGGIITDPNNPTSTFSGLAENAYTLRWTISTLCDTKYDDVYINFYTNFCPSTITDIDNNTYNTVQIGNQCWMKENLKTTTYNNGTSIPGVCACGWWQNLSAGAYTWLDDDSFWKNKYGALYNWYAVNDTSGLCPSGWHVPTDDEWTVLTDFIGGESNGNMLKSCRMENSPLGGDCNTLIHPRWDQDVIEYGTDDYGFSGLPGSALDPYYWTPDIGKVAGWWSSTGSVPEYAWVRLLQYDWGIVFRYGEEKKWGMSVRCLRD